MERYYRTMPFRTSPEAAMWLHRSRSGPPQGVSRTFSGAATWLYHSRSGHPQRRSRGFFRKLPRGFIVATQDLWEHLCGFIVTVHDLLRAVRGFIRAAQDLLRSAHTASSRSHWSSHVASSEPFRTSSECPRGFIRVVQDPFGALTRFHQDLLGVSTWLHQTSSECLRGSIRTTQDLLQRFARLHQGHPCGFLRTSWEVHT